MSFSISIALDFTALRYAEPCHYRYFHEIHFVLVWICISSHFIPLTIFMSFHANLVFRFMASSSLLSLSPSPFHGVIVVAICVVITITITALLEAPLQEPLEEPLNP